MNLIRKVGNNYKLTNSDLIDLQPVNFKVEALCIETCNSAYLIVEDNWLDVRSKIHYVLEKTS